MSKSPLVIALPQGLETPLGALRQVHRPLKFGSLESFPREDPAPQAASRKEGSGPLPGRLGLPRGMSLFQGPSMPQARLRVFIRGLLSGSLGALEPKLHQSWVNTGLREEGRELSPPQGLPRLLLRKPPGAPKGQKRASPALLGKGVLEGQQLSQDSLPPPIEGRRPPASPKTPRP